jgi:hypothetical protein
MTNYLACTRRQASASRATWDGLRRCACALFMLFSLLANSKPLWAQEDVQNVDSPVVLDHRDFDTSDADILNPVAIAYSYDADLFFLLQPVTQTQYELFAVTPYEHALGSITLDIASSGPFHMAFDGRRERLLLLTPDELLEIPIGWNGALVPASDPIHHTLVGWPIDHAQGMTVDLTTGDLFILNGVERTVIEMAPDAKGNFSNAHLVGTTTLDLPAGVSSSGLTRNDTTRHFYTLSNSGGAAYELTNSGELQRIYSLAGVNLTSPQALVLAPTADNTDDPDALDLFVLDAKPLYASPPAEESLAAPQVENVERAAGAQHLFLPSISGFGPGTKSVGATSNRMFELFLTPRGVVRASATMISATLERTTDTSSFSPPSPDPSGVAYMSHANSLFIGDGEVDEMDIFAGDNLWETTLAGNVVDSYSSIVNTDYQPNDEPAGVAYAPPGFFFTNPHLFLSDDTTGSWITVIDLGADHKYGTADDRRSQFSTTPFGAGDPEGLAYDSSNNAILIADGTGEEIYRLAPGPNGRFDGVAPDGDDQATHFDVSSLGIRDPEGIEFNPNNGHLYIAARTDELIAETLPNGTLVQYIDISAANSFAVAGLTFGPSSTNPSQMHLYIVDRGVDNNHDPNENDGKLYEMSFPNGDNVPPFVDAGPDQTISISAAASLAGTVADDGLPNPPGTVTTQWSKVSGPGNVVFADATSRNTTATFSEIGTYVLRLNANDGAADSNFATVTITVTPAPSAADDGYSLNEDEVLSVSASGLLSNDTASDGSALTAVKVTDPAHGVLTLSGDGSFLYTPALNYNGSDSFTYKASNDSGDSNIATVIVSITPINDAPIATNDSRSTDENSVLTLAAPGVLENDSDVDGGELTAILVTAPVHGTLTLEADGSYVYTPAPNFSGTDSFTYKVSDGSADSNIATVLIAIGNISVPLIAADDSYSTMQDAVLTVAAPGVMNNDPNPGRALLTAVKASDPAHGELTFQADGSFIYSPTAGFSGVDSFTYRVREGSADSNIATVTITINPIGVTTFLPKIEQ